MDQTIAQVSEGSLEDYEEGMQACSEATKIWMQVSYQLHGSSAELTPFLNFYAFCQTNMHHKRGVWLHYYVPPSYKSNIMYTKHLPPCARV